MARLDDPADLVRLLADPVRLALIGRAAEGNVSIDGVAAAFDLPKRKVAEALGKLRASGLVTGDLELNRDGLRKIASSLPTAESAAAAITEGPWSDEEKRTLRRFFTGTRLNEIPAQSTKRRLVLERLAQEFEPGFRYEERDLNFALQMFHPDYASLRRYMVEEGILTRADGVYWRTGGRYPIDGDPG